MVNPMRKAKMICVKQIVVYFTQYFLWANSFTQTSPGISSLSAGFRLCARTSHLQRVPIATFEIAQALYHAGIYQQSIVPAPGELTEVTASHSRLVPALSTTALSSGNHQIEDRRPALGRYTMMTAFFSSACSILINVGLVGASPFHCS
jgi:hypothetical protein